MLQRTRSLDLTMDTFILCYNGYIHLILKWTNSPDVIKDACFKGCYTDRTRPIRTLDETMTVYIRSC